MGGVDFRTADFSKSYITNSLDAMPGGFFIYKARDPGQILYANQAMLDIFECTDWEEFTELTGGTFNGMVFANDIEKINSNIWTQINGGKQHFDYVCYRIKTRTGKIRYVESFGRLFTDPEKGPLFYDFLVDGQVRYLESENDELTGFPGMRRFLEYSSRLLDAMRNDRTSPEYSIIYFNITNFRQLNAVHGIQEGNKILKQMSVMLKTAYPNNYITRHNEDHFIVLTESDGMIDRLERLYRYTMELFPGDRVGLKAGIYRINDIDISPSRACDYAKAACDSIRDNRMTFFCEYQADLERAQKIKDYIIKNFNDAIYDGRIREYYRPIMNMENGEICGLEAVSRWIDPEFGAIDTAYYINVLEEARKIDILDTYVLQSVMKFIKGRMNRGEKVVPVSLNLSRRDFEVCDVFYLIEKALKEYDLPREYISIEVRADTALTSQYIREKIRKFSDAGYPIQMDNFGVGQSPLSSLKDLDFFTGINIDASFLKQKTERSEIILSSIVSLAKSLGLHVLCAGVENEEQFNFLKDIGCEKVQGHFVGRATSADLISSDLKFVVE